MDPSLWRRVVLPTEHGGWAFLAEPMLLGLLVAPSWAGALLAVAALAAFLSRQPMRTVVLDRRRGRRHPRTRVAERALLACMLAAMTATALALLRSEGPAAIALGAILPLAATALIFDGLLQPRALAAELSGVLAAGGLVAAIALAGGWPLVPAFGLWGVMAARSVPSILYVRARLRLERAVTVDRRWPMIAAIVSLLFCAWLAWEAVVPWSCALAMLMLALRAAHGLSSRRVRMPTWALGVSEIGFGLLVVLSVVLGMALEGPRARRSYLARSEPIMRSKSEAAADTVALGPVSLKNTKPCGPSTIAPISS